MRGMHWVVFFIAVLFGMAGCGGGGGGATPNAPSGETFISGGVDVLESGASYFALVKVTNSSWSGAAITDAIVAVNGVSLTYDQTVMAYVGSTVAPDAAGKFNLSVTANGATYTATEPALTSVPVVTMSVPFTAATVNHISWTAPAGATADVRYFLTVSESNTLANVYSFGDTALTSADVPANTTKAGTSYVVGLDATQCGTIANAAYSSGFCTWVFALAPKFMAQ